MTDNTRLLLIVGAIAAALYYFSGDGGLPQPNPSPTPAPCPDCPDTRPKRPKKPWGRDEYAPFGAFAPFETITIGGNTAPDGKATVQTDLPVSERIRNIGSKKDGAGMCVMSSIEMAARWANIEMMRGLRDWCANQPGGGYPAKVDQQLKQYCQAKGIVCPDYVQYEGNDPSILALALKTGRMPAVTYSGKDGVRYKGPIAHMTNLPAFMGSWACVLDNNAVGENELLWMTPQEFLERWTSDRSGWCFVWLTPPAMPAPKNR